MTQIRIAYSDGRIEDRALQPGSYLIGRDSGDLVLGDPNASSRHAQLEVRGDELVVTDVGSTNGTFDARGQRLSAPLRLFSNDTFRIGTTVFTLLPSQRRAPGGTQVMSEMPALPPAPPAAQAGPPPAYAPPPAYGAPPPAYGAPSPNPYGAPPGGYGTPSNPGAPGPSFGGPSFGGASYGTPGQGPSGYGAPPAPYGGGNPGAYGGYDAGPAFNVNASGVGAGGEAPWITRVLGFLIDQVIVAVLFGVLTMIWLLLSALLSSAGGGDAIMSGSMCIGFVLYPFAALTVGAFNRVYLVTTRGSTIGQGVVKLRVVDGNGALLTVGSAAIRLVAQVGLGFIPIVGLVDLLFPLWDPRRQTLHDKTVGSFVVVNAPPALDGSSSYGV